MEAIGDLDSRGFIFPSSKVGSFFRFFFSLREGEVFTCLFTTWMVSQLAEQGLRGADEDQGKANEVR